MKGVLGRIRNMGFEDDDKINLLLYGQSGTGKTTLAGKFPGNTLWIVASGTKSSDELRSIDTPENRKRIKEVKLGIPDEDDDGERTPVMEEFAQVLRHAADGDYANVVLDHVTGLADLLLRDVLGLEELPPQKSFGMASREQYGQQGLQVKTCLRDLLDLPQTVIIIGHERKFNGSEDDESQEFSSEGLQARIGCSLPPRTVDWLNGAVGYIARTFIRPKKVMKEVKVGDKVKQVEVQSEKPEYCLRVGPSGLYQTKFRIPGGVKGDTVVNPTYEKIMALVRGETAE